MVMPLQWRRRLPLPPLLALFALITLITLVAGSPAMAQTPLSLDAAVASATARSRLVAAATAQTLAARERAAAAGQRPDPILRLGLNNLPIDGPDRYSVTRDFMTMRSLALTQELTRADKLQARSERSLLEVEASLIAREASLVDLQRDAALAWFEGSFLDSMRELLQGQIAQAQVQAQAAQVQYRNGRGAQADVFEARGDVEQLHDRLAQTERRIDIARTALGRWVGDEAARPIAARPALVLPTWALGDLAQPLKSQSQIAAAAQQVAVAGSEAALARAARRADWSVEMMISQRGPAYSTMVSLNLSVPLQWDPRDRQDRELAAQLADLEQARARLEDLERARQAEVRAMLMEWQGHEERLHRYDTTLLPLARQRSDAALTAYRAGTGSLPMVLGARGSELEMQMERLRIERDRARLWAQLEYLLPAHVQSDVGLFFAHQEAQR